VPSACAPAALLGQWKDDYGSRHTISDSLWQHGSAARYHILRWDSAGQFLVARNDPDNPSDGGLWTRIDWMPLDSMPPYRLAFCMSAYRAPSADSAAAITIADRTSPRTGCNGFPFTRMARSTLDATVTGRDPYRSDSLPPE
jgi:hypothetical protein